MKNILKSWKTSLLGGGAITTGLIIFINNPDEWQKAVAALALGLLGLLSKDAGVTHSKESTN